MARAATVLFVAALSVVGLMAFGLSRPAAGSADLLAQDAGGLRPGAAGPSTTYEAFMALPPADRLARFRELDPEAKALIFRTHAGRWLEANRPRLTPAKIAIVEDHIAYFTPAFWRTPDDPEIAHAGEELDARRRCGLSQWEIREAFDVLGKSEGQSFSLLEEFWTWWDCVTG